MRQKIFSNRAIRHVAIALVLAAFLVPISTSPVAAISIGDYFDISYEPISFSKTDIYGSEVFYAEIQGSATCIETLPSPYDQVTGLRLTFKIIAEHEVSHDEVTLNSSYAITMSPFPIKAGKHTEIHELVPLQFPKGSQSGDYDVSGELIIAEAKAFGLWLNVTDQIPPEYHTLAMDGPVTYTAPPNSAPDMPNSPSPANDATGVSLPVNLSVVVSDPDDDALTVTFRNASNHSAIGTDAEVPSGSRAEVTWSGLATNTTYSWYAEASDGELDSTPSDTWSFTTAPANNPPNLPSNPSPANHAAGVSIDADLSWTGGDPDAGDTVTYDVYFGISATPPLVSNDQTGAPYNPGTLDYNTKYYWKITARDNHAASTTGPVWDFTTALPPAGDILAYYRGLGLDPNVVETTDLLKAINDWANGEIPPDFSQAITTTQLLQLIGDWAAGT